MKFFTNEEAVFSRLTIPTHLCGWDNVAHGGVVSAILDETMSWAAIYLLKNITLTQSMTFEFIKPVSISETMEAKGRVLELKGKRDAIIEGIVYNSDEKVCARSTGVFKVFSPAVAKRLRIANEEMLSWFENLFDVK